MNMERLIEAVLSADLFEHGRVALLAAMASAGHQAAAAAGRR